MTIEITVNKYWHRKKKPFITVMTPVYNRRSTILRAMKSVENQVFRNIEYIIIDDGSKEGIDDIVCLFMDSVDFPVMFIKKPNGGVHTARNVGYKNARGELILCIDSDDELTPSACDIFYKTWISIPKNQREKCWQIKAQCVDQNGKMTATPFPDNINYLPKGKARKYYSLAGGEQIGCRVVKIMKNNLFPEPEGVTFVAESAVWVPLERRFKSWGINDVVRIYHTEGNDHLSRRWKGKNKQTLRNNLWNITYKLNHAKEYSFGILRYIKSMIYYCIFSRLLLECGDKKFIQQNKLEGFNNNFWKAIIWGPSLLLVFCINRGGDGKCI